jgi:hypothetical protein
VKQLKVSAKKRLNRERKGGEQGEVCGLDSRLQLGSGGSIFGSPRPALEGQIERYGGKIDTMGLPCLSHGKPLYTGETESIR